MKLTATGFSEVTPPDYAEAKRALAVLIAPGATFELRALPYGRSAVCRSVTEALAAIETFRHAAGVYYTLNPCRADLDTTAKDRDIIDRRWFLIDLDPVRPKDTSATDEEKDAARGLAQVMVAALSNEGWPLPVIVDSGNGFHLLYRVDLPADKLARQWVKGGLKSLAERFDLESVKVDRSVHNEARIAKLPGTWARKGTETPDRPHRMARLVFVPEVVQSVTTEQLKALLDVQPESTPEPPWKSERLTVRATSGGGVDAYCLAALHSETAAVVLAPDGDRNNRLNVAAFKLGTLLHFQAFSRSDVEQALSHAARRAGLSDREIATTIRSGLDAGILEPREIPERAAERPKSIPTPGPALDPDDLVIIRASEVTPRSIEWLWQDRIPLGLMTMFVGKTSVGKSFVLCDIAARLSRGDTFPDGTAGGLAGSVFISEDPYDTILVPRLIELGANLDRISFLKWEVQGRFTLASTEILDAACDQTGDVKLVVIDPPSNFLAGADEHKNAEVRAVLMPLAAWAADRRIAICLITHFNKQGGKGVDAQMRVMGSAAWLTSVRVAHGLFHDAEQNGTRLFLPIKTNVGQLPKGISYKIEPTSSLARVEWCGSVDVSADDAVNGTKRRPRFVVAGDWLEEMFRRQPSWNARELNLLAKEEGISRDALIEARQRVPIRWTRVADPHGDYEVVWRSTDPRWPPPKCPESPET